MAEVLKKYEMQIEDITLIPSDGGRFEVTVDGKLVFLKLGEELASDATPSLTITEGREVEEGDTLTIRK